MDSWALWCVTPLRPCKKLIRRKTQAGHWQTHTKISSRLTVPSESQLTYEVEDSGCVLRVSLHVISKIFNNINRPFAYFVKRYRRADDSPFANWISCKCCPTVKPTVYKSDRHCDRRIYCLRRRINEAHHF